MGTGGEVWSMGTSEITTGFLPVIVELGTGGEVWSMGTYDVVDLLPG